MKPTTMTETEKEAPACVFVVEGSQSATEQPTPKRRLNRKHVIIAVTCVAIVALIVIGVLVAIKLWTDANVTIAQYQHQVRYGDTFIQNSFYYDSSTNVRIEYEVRRPNTKVTAINDLSKGFQVLKMEEETGKYVCVIVNRSSTPITEDGIQKLADFFDSLPTANDGQIDDMPLNVNNVAFNLTGPINNADTMFDQLEQDLCYGLPVYMATVTPVTSNTSVPTVATTTLGSVGRQRRGTTVYYCSVCWTCCTSFYFPDAPSRSYYACTSTCQYVYYP